MCKVYFNNATLHHVFNSYPKVRAPNASPASQLRSGTSVSLDTGTKKLPKFSKVEVQEVFELEDLHSNWDKTFRATQCYVWVPHDPKNKRPRSRYKYSERFLFNIIQIIICDANVKTWLLSLI